MRSIICTPGKRRVVHEEIDRPIGGGLGQRLPQPCEAPIAELSAVAHFVERVEKQEAADRRVAPALHEAIGVARCRRQHIEAGSASVMVADENRVEHAQGTHGGAEITIGIHLPQWVRSPATTASSASAWC